MNTNRVDKRRSPNKSTQAGSPAEGVFEMRIAIQIIKRLFCRHEFRVVVVPVVGPLAKRLCSDRTGFAVWQCHKCGKVM